MRNIMLLMAVKFMYGNPGGPAFYELIRFSLMFLEYKKVFGRRIRSYNKWNRFGIENVLFLESENGFLRFFQMGWGNRKWVSIVCFKRVLKSSAIPIN